MVATKEYSACAVQLRQYIERYLRRCKAAGKPTSMRKLARDRLGWNAMALIRWSTENAPKNWRIPLGRIPLVAQVLELKPTEVDELMSLRLGELEQADHLHEAVAATRWALQLSDRAPGRGVSQELARLNARYQEGLPGNLDLETEFLRRVRPELERLERELVLHEQEEIEMLTANQSTDEDSRMAHEKLARAGVRHAIGDQPRISRKVRSLVRRIKEESKRSGPR